MKISFESVWPGFELQFGIDLGTTNTLIYQKGKGIILREPSVVAVRRDTGRIEACGEQARDMIGRTPEAIDVIYPLRNGVIADFELTAAMLSHFFRIIQNGALGFGLRFRQRFAKRRLMITIPCGASPVHKKAVEMTTLHKSAQRIVAIEEPLAAALGAGLPFFDPVGSMVIDIGGGTTQVAVLSLGGIVVSHTLAKGGISIDLGIMEYLRKCHNLAIGERTAEAIKLQIGSAVMPAAGECMEVRGNDLVSGLPKSISITAVEIHEVLNGFINDLVELIRSTLENCPPELAGDVMENGILLCGGGALLRGLDRRLASETAIPVHLAEEPLDCIALGAGKMLEKTDGQLGFPANI